MKHFIIFTEEDMKKLNNDEMVAMKDPMTNSTILFTTEKGYADFCAEDDLC